jgi:hypothetical protein
LAVAPRAGYEAERAAWQYQACAPEHRLVARELERRGEDALHQQRQLEEAFERWQRAAPARLSAEDKRAMRSLAADLPAVWQAVTTSAADRQRIARLLLERVAVTVDKTSARIEVELHWAGGLVQSHTLTRRVSRSDQQTDYPRLVQRLRALCGEQLSSAAVAARLNAEGFRPPKRTDRFTRSMVLRLTAHLGLTRRARHGRLAGRGPNEYRPASLARRLGICRDTVRRWLRAGWLNARRDADGHHIIWADADELRRLRQLHQLPRTWPNKRRLAELQKPKQRPAR